MSMSNDKSILSSGILGLQYGHLSQLRAGDVAVIGVPVDVEFGARRGADQGPDAIRRMSLVSGRHMACTGVDLGNLALVAGWKDQLKALIRHLESIGTIPLILGGDQTVGRILVHSMTRWNVVALLPRVISGLGNRETGVLWLGLNGAQDAGNWRMIIAADHSWRTARQLDEDPAEYRRPEGEFILWLDLSVIDLGHASGAIGLNPGGLTPETLIACLSSLGRPPKAMVVTGLAPSLDSRGISELAAVEAILGLIGNA